MTTTLQRALLEKMGEDRVLHHPGDCWPYGYDNSRRHAPPDAVTFPSTHEDVLAITAICNELRAPLIARGRGTGTTGATVPVTGGVVVSFERMADIIELDCDNRVIVVQPGVTNQAVQDAAREAGFFWPPDPTSAAFCTVGGNLAYNSAGPRAVKYGTPRENTLGLRAVTGDGKDIKTGVYTTKGVVGYDLTRLIIGSEGTLALITEATLKLTPLPETIRTMQAVYRSVADATRAVTRIMTQPVIPCALEFMDNNAIHMIRNYAPVNLPEHAGALLMIEVDGLESAISHAVDRIRDAATGEGLLEFKEAKTKAESDALWTTRKALSPALRHVAPKKINEDVVVPIAAMPQFIEQTAALSLRYDIAIVNFGHAGNGNIHVNLLVDPFKPGALDAAHQCLDEVFTLVLKLGGTLSGEHGIGLEKRDFIDREITPATLDLMQRIKSQFDPNAILNPTKLFPIRPKNSVDRGDQ